MYSLAYYIGSSGRFNNSPNNPHFHAVSESQPAQQFAL